MKPLDTLKTFIKHNLTGADNDTYDVARVLWVLGVVSYIVYGGIHIYHNGTFNPTDYGTGLGIALAGGGIGIAVKGNTEPK